MNSIDSLITFPLGQPVAIFLLVLIIILVAPILFDRLRIPRIVGLILAGVLVGPYGLNLLAYDASFKIFGEVGILYLMFIAAVEIDMYHLKQNIRRGLIFGIITCLIPLIVGMFVNRWVFSASWTTAVLIAVMYASHTLISYPIISKFGLSSNRAAVVAVSGTIVAVLLALIVLAEVIDVRVSGAFGIRRLCLLLLMTGIYSAVVGFTFPAVTRYFFRKFNDTVVQFIFILAMVFLSSLFAKLIGLEAILGAFLAGLVLNRFVPSRSALKSRLEFVGNAIFIPYFLIGVGMLINVHVLFKGIDVIEGALVMTVTALVTKYASVLISGQLFGFNRAERMMLFGLSSGKAAATIAATMIGYQYGLLNEDLMNGAVVMILICCIVAPVVTEKSSMIIRMELTGKELEDESGQHPGFARQIVAVANPITSEGLMRTAVFMRSPENTEPVTLLFVRSSDDRRIVETGRNALSGAAAMAQSMSVDCNEVERYDLNIVAGLTNTLKEKNATEIVIGLHRKSNIVDTFFGSMSEALLKSTDKMIIMSRCFVPVDTVRKVFVYVPKNAEYETGFHAWLARIANLSAQIGRKVVFIAFTGTSRFIEEFIKEQEYPFNRSYSAMESWDDFLILSSQVSEDDLFIVVSARKGSLSWSADVDNMPGLIGRHFLRHNLILIYPSQFGS